MDRDDAEIFEMVASVVARYGMKRTTMADLARGAGVSRQTLYDRFGDKDGVMAAAIDHMVDRVGEELSAAFAKGPDLAAKLDAYFQIAVWPTFEIMQSMPDAADLETGMGPASAAASRRMSDRKREALTRMLSAHLPADGQSPEEVAAFFEQSSSRAKMSGTSRQDLERFLTVLKAAVLALCRSA